MAITNYATLRTAVAGTAKDSWGHRADLLSNFDTFLQLAQEEMYQGVDVSVDPQPLRVRDLQTTDTDTLSTSVRTLALPTNYLEFHKLQLSYSTSYFKPLEYRDAQNMEVYSTTGRPYYYTITSQIEFDRVADVAYTLNRVYYAKLTDLSSSQTTHAVLTRFPSIFLYGCLFEAFKWAQNDVKALQYGNLFQGAINKANHQDEWSAPSPSAYIVGSVA